MGDKNGFKQYSEINFCLKVQLRQPIKSEPQMSGEVETSLENFLNDFKNLKTENIQYRQTNLFKFFPLFFN
jgi:hypothetical protein